MSDWYQQRFGRRQAAAQPRQGPPTYQQQRPPPGYTPPPDPRSVPTNIGNLWQQMQSWRGGPAHKVDANPCPHCGSNHYYSRAGDGVMRGPPPAPHCFDCGYNGMFEQGLASSWNG